mmetsp:Transcript_22508/g.10868  ORF Transcript_22508/g.10868 Transcript_22508/m.10868 type:complete len:474 (-) Transcript_22508:1445-2866(-)
MDSPRIIIAALKGGSGKTILSLGIIAALKRLGKSVAVYKKGPDYIDAGWLALAADRPCYNLDNFLVSKEQVKHSFISHTQKDDIAVIEGNRGIFDGLDVAGATSTAELSKLIDSPVILCLDCTKSTRTMAAIVNGALKFDTNVRIKGVILNRIAGRRHERILRETIEKYCEIPVLGAVPKLKKEIFPERHMGLVPTPEHDWSKDSIEYAAEIAEKYLDIEAIIEIAKQTSTLTVNIEDSKSSNNFESKNIEVIAKPKIGIIKDSAFQFYYPENLEALCEEGAKLVFISPLKKSNVFDIDGLYIGGGFPETHASQLADNKHFKSQLKMLVKKGFPVYGECGGLMYLGSSIKIDNKIYPMTEILPIEYSFLKKPCAHGYTIISVENKNPYFEVGSKIKGHEFHYSKVERWKGKDEQLAFSMIRGKGLINRKDGVCYKNVFGTYTHLHAIGTPAWAKALVRLAISFQKKGCLDGVC